MKMSCIAAVSRAIGREITKAEADGIEGRVRSALRQLALKDLDGYRAMAVATRLEEAAKMAAIQIKADAASAKRQALSTIAAHDRNDIAIAEMRRIGFDPQEAVDRLLLENNDGRAPVMALETRIRATQDLYRRELTDTMEAVSPRFFGFVARKEGADAVTMELFGKDSGIPLAKKAAAEWRDLADRTADHFRDAGGALHRLADWRFPQHHDQARVAVAGEQWVNDVTGWLDRGRYVNEAGRLMDDAEFRSLLVDVQDTIGSGGANKIEPGAQVGSTKIANRNLDHRVLHFKDAESYLAYQAKYGGKDLWSTMTGHIDHIARQTAVMEQFGPNADREFAFWNAWAQRENRTNPKAQATARELDDAYRYLAGYSNGIANAFWARAFDDTRNVLSAAKLGSAVVSSIPDLATLTMTASYNRLSIMGTYINGIRAIAGGAEGRAELQRHGLMVNSAQNAARRYQVDDLGASFTSKMSNGILSLSGLNRWTDGWRGGYAATQAHTLARMMQGDIHPADLKILRARGITDTDLAVWKAATPDSTRFGDLLTADAIYRIPDANLAGVKLPVSEVARSPLDLKREAAVKLLGLLLSESHMAIVEPSARDRLMMGAGKPRGEFKGELERSFWQFKSFPWSFMRKHFKERGWQGGENYTGFGSELVGGRLAYIAPLFTITTLLGAAAMEINDMLTGKDPRPLYGADGKVLVKNWIAAVLKGGALGVYGDFLGAEATQDARSALATTLGPIAGLASDAASFALSNPIQMLGNRPTRAGYELTNLAKGITPGSNLWYTKAATDHYLFNWLQEQMNPGHAARVESRVRREYGQKFWWGPNQKSPQRPPDLGAILGH
jgi:hypothetical protein